MYWIIQDSKFCTSINLEALATCIPEEVGDDHVPSLFCWFSKFISIGLPLYVREKTVIRYKTSEWHLRTFFFSVFFDHTCCHPGRASWLLHQGERDLVAITLSHTPREGYSQVNVEDLIIECRWPVVHPQGSSKASSLSLFQHGHGGFGPIAQWWACMAST